jgi:hypothetical protein
VLDIQYVSGDLVSGEELPLRMRRKLGLQCTECGEPSPDAEVCPMCRAKATKRQAGWRARRRKAKLCVDCGQRSRKRRCRKCVRKKRGVTERRRGVDGAAAQTPKLVAKLEVDARYPDGRVRMREVGRGTRGAPNRQQLETDDVRLLVLAMREIEKAIPAIEAANALPSDMPRIQREAARRDALAAADLAQRLIDETLDRNKYGQEAQMRLMTRAENKRNRPR